MATMRKLLSLMLMLALLWGGQALPAGAEAETAAANLDVKIGEERWIESSAYYDGRLYLSSQGYLVYTPGGEALEQMEVKDLRPAEQTDQDNPYGAPLSFVSDGGRLYGVTLNKGFIHPLSAEGLTLTIGEGVAIDTQPLRNMEYGDEGYVESPMQMLAVDGRLYLVNRSWDMNGTETLSLCSYDLEKGGAMTPYGAEFVWRITPYKEGKMLAEVLDPEKAWDEKTKQNNDFSLAVWDPASDTLEELGGSGVKFNYEGVPMVYDAQSDYLYMQGRSEIYRREPSGEIRIGAYLVPSEYGRTPGDNLFLLGGNGLLSVAGKNIMLREADPEKLPAVRLTVYGSYMDQAHQKAISAMGGLPVTFLDNKWFESAQQLGQALVTGEDGIDLLMVNTDYMDLKNLMSKGFAADLSGNAVLSEYADKLYPFLKEQGVFEGKLYMVPVQLYSEGIFGYYPDLFEKMGLEVPGSFTDLVDLLQTWNDDMAEEHSDYAPLISEDYKRMLLHRAIRMKMSLDAAAGKEFTYSDPELKQMLEAVLALDTANIAPKIDWSDNLAEADEQMNELYNRIALMEDYYSLDLESLNYQMFGGDADRERTSPSGEMLKIGQSKPLYLSATGGDAKEPVRLHPQMMFVNPKSQHLEEAIAYLAEYVKNQEPVQLSMMMPGLNEDIENPDYERIMKDLQESASYFEKQISQAEGAEKRQLEQDYENFKRYMENRKTEGKYRVRKETIAYYRELIENSVVLSYSEYMAVNNKDIYPLIQRLYEGQMKIDQFVTEADGKLRLMRLENQ